MPIITGEETSGLVYASPTTDPVVPVNVISVTSENYIPVAVDNKVNPVDTLLEHVEGASWTLKAYYSQILTKDSQLNAQQTGTSAAYQQYNKIEALEVKVTSPLSQTQDPKTKAITYVGTALVYSLLIPNEGDMFVAAIGDGQLGIFTVTSTVKKSVFRKSTYEISYAISTTDLSFIQDLDIKTVNVYVYRKDFLSYGQDPLVIKRDNNQLLNLSQTYSVLARQYFPRFFDKEFKTFTLPGQPMPTYDPFLTDFIVRMFGNDDSPILQEVRRLNVSDDPVMSQDNFWTALINKNMSYLKTGFTKATVVSTSGFSYDPFFNSIRYTGVKLCVYPLDPALNINNTDAWSLKPPAPQSIQEVPGGGIGVGIVSADGSQTVYDIQPVLTDTYYVLSGSFYNQTNTQTALENAVSLFLNNEKLDPVMLNRLANEFMTWGLLEQFYYVPILLMLIRASIRTYQG